MKFVWQWLVLSCLTSMLNFMKVDYHVEYLYHGISNRSFIRSFTLAEYVEVKKASMKDGILTVFLSRELPESQKPKTIDITYLN
jgi:molecular chaperone IbpA